MPIVCTGVVTSDVLCGTLTVSHLGLVSAQSCVTHTSIAAPLALARNRVLDRCLQRIPVVLVICHLLFSWLPSFVADSECAYRGHDSVRPSSECG